jgi:diacylglycerol kinase family enzyme
MLIGKKFSGSKVFISNAAHYGKTNPAPKAHPGDGKFDILKVELSTFQTIQAIKRVQTGTHLPHPGIKYERVESKQFSLKKKMKVEIDGKRIGKFQNVSLRIENEALRVVV